MHIDIVSNLLKVHEEETACDRLAPVEAVFADHHPRHADLLGYLPQYVGISFGRAVC